jgi:hypothetical protein
MALKDDRLPQLQELIMTEERYWIAINGPSCARSSLPMRNPRVTPTPQQLFGFLTPEEAQKAQHICLTAPIPEVKKFMRDLQPGVASGRVRYIRPEHPQPPTRGQTMWTEDEGVHQAVQHFHIKTTAN